MILGADPKDEHLVNCCNAEIDAGFSLSACGRPKKPATGRFEPSTFWENKAKVGVKA